MQSARVVTIGAGIAGLRMVERLRRLGFTGQLTLVGAEPYHPYDRPPLSKALLTSPQEPVIPLLRAPDRFSELDVDLRLGRRATSLLGDMVRLDDGSELPFDHLVIATGLTARSIPAWSQRPRVHTLRGFDDCLALRAAARQARHATVVGAGVLGCEIAASLRDSGLSVDMVDPLPQPLVRVVGAQVGAIVAELHRAHGVRLHLGAAVDRFEGTGRVTRVQLTDGTGWDTDLVIMAIGSVPVTEWLEGSAVAIGDGVLTDDCGATSAPGVWAVGDVARVPYPRGTAGGTVRVENWTSAGDGAAVVAGNIAAALRGEPPRAFTAPPYAWSDQYGVKLQCLGLPVKDGQFEVVAGNLAQRHFLGVYTSEGIVRAVAGIGMPAALMRCRAAVEQGVAVDQLIEQAPWERKQVRT